MNGDFVDRGVYGVEVVLLLFVAHLLFPEVCHPEFFCLQATCEVITRHRVCS